MGKSRSLIRVATVVAVAFGAGHWVQSMNTPTEPAAAIPQKISMVSAGPSVAPSAKPGLEMLIKTQATVAPIEQPDCTVIFNAENQPGYMIGLSILAPCKGNSRVVLRHAGLTFADRLDAEGRLQALMPAMDATGLVSVLFADAQIMQAVAPVAEVEKLRRIAVQSIADDRFGLYAVENEDNFTMPTPSSDTKIVSKNGGSLQVLGDAGADLPMIAQVYTWPEDSNIVVDVSVEAEVTDLTCDRELLGETIQSIGGQVAVNELTVAMPDCDAVGDFVLLTNFISPETLTLAQ